MRCRPRIDRILDNLMLRVVSPRIWFPSMQIVWAILTFGYKLIRTYPLPLTDVSLLIVPARSIMCSRSILQNAEIRSLVKAPFGLDICHPILPGNGRIVNVRRDPLYSWVVSILGVLHFFTSSHMPCQVVQAKGTGKTLSNLHKLWTRRDPVSPTYRHILQPALIGLLDFLVSFKQRFISMYVFLKHDFIDHN